VRDGETPLWDRVGLPLMQIGGLILVLTLDGCLQLMPSGHTRMVITPIGCDGLLLFLAGASVALYDLARIRPPELWHRRARQERAPKPAYLARVSPLHARPLYSSSRLLTSNSPDA
jgi:hypothetical protein